MKIFLYSSSVYSCHFFLLYSASDNHDGVITDLELDIMEYEVKWHDHHVLLCRLITAQGYPAKEAGENQLTLHSPNTQFNGMTGNFSLFT